MKLLKDAGEILRQRGEKRPNFPREAERVCTAFKAVTGIELNASQYGLLLVCMKLVREGHGTHDRDNLLDAVGYLALVDWCNDEASLARKAD